MQWRAFGPVFFLVEPFEKVGPGRHHIAHPAAHRAKRINPRLGGQRLVRHIQRHHRQFAPGGEHDFGRFGIDINIELGCRGDVAHLKIRATHQHDFLHPGDDIGGLLERGGDIGQWAQRAQGDGAGGGSAQGFNDEIHRMPGLQRHGRVVHLRPVQPGFAMHMFGGDQFAQHRRGASGEHRQIRAARQFADDPGVARCQRQRHIACDRCDAQHLDFSRRGEGQQNRHGVILSGVGIDNDLTGRHAVWSCCWLICLTKPAIHAGIQWSRQCPTILLLWQRVADPAQAGRGFVADGGGTDFIGGSWLGLA